MSLIRVLNISVGYSKENILENISFEIKEGELLGVIGENGCGKSTLAKAICNVLPHSGEVYIDEEKNEDLKFSQIAQNISYVPQHSGLGIDISVLDVVMMGFNSRLKTFENPSLAMRSEAMGIINLLGLSDKAHNNYMELSEGQKQLVVIARALVSNGKLLVMDEPENALDFSVRFEIMNIVKKWIENEKRAGIAILHDIALALNNCDKLILIKDKSISSIIDMHCDTIESMEDKLRMIYGDISIGKVKNKKGKDIFYMVCESEGV
ncbi:MAG: ABC transporter ATP-binding protein [Lachnospiraceae bacterium]|nr:ABC transporter ATP-binding protein [Lachnospiraceae bacterium]